jgi:hypothetical protein
VGAEKTNEQKQEDRTRENEHERETETSRRKECKERKSLRPEPALLSSSFQNQVRSFLYSFLAIDV